MFCMRLLDKTYMTTALVVLYSSRFSLVSQSHKLSSQFSLLKTTLSLFPSLIQPKAEPPDSLGVTKWLVKCTWVWRKMTVGLNFLPHDFT